MLLNQVASRRINSAFKRISTLWSVQRDAIGELAYQPDKLWECEGHFAVIMRSATRIGARPEILSLVESWNFPRQQRSARAALTYRLRRSYGPRLKALQKLLNFVSSGVQYYVSVLASLYAASRLKGSEKERLATCTRFENGPGGPMAVYINSTFSPGTPSHGAPPEIPPRAIRERLAQNVGARPQTFKMGESTPLHKFLVSKPEYFDKYLPRDSYMVVPSGAFATSAAHVGKYFEENSGDATDEEVSQVILDSGDQLRFSLLQPPSAHCFYTTGVKPKAAPGFDSTKVDRSKGRLADWAGAACEMIWSTLEYTQIFDTSAWAAGGREKRQWRALGERLTSRIVMQPEAVLSQFGCAIAHPITLMLQRNRGDLLIGFSFAHGKWRSFQKKHDLDHCKAFDWSSFDSHVGERLLVAAMGVLRSAYAPSKRMDRAFIYLLSNIVFKDLIIPGGHVVRITGGIPSGHPFTSLLGSVANWIIHRTVNVRLIGRTFARRVRMSFLGDDSLISYPDGNVAPETDEYLAVANRQWRAEGKASANLEGFLSTSNPETSLPFLGTRFVNGFPGLSTSDWISMDLGDKRPRLDPAWRAQEPWVYGGMPNFNLEALRLHEDMVHNLVDTNPDHPRMVGHDFVDAMFASVFKTSVLCYLTEDSGTYAWAEDMQGSRVPPWRLPSQDRPVIWRNGVDALVVHSSKLKESAKYTLLHNASRLVDGQVANSHYWSPCPILPLDHEVKLMMVDKSRRTQAAETFVKGLSHQLKEISLGYDRLS